MNTKEKDRTVSKIEVCWLDCIFYASSNDYPDHLTCEHPYWEDKEDHERYIITKWNRSRIPEDCPLRREPLVMKFEIKN